MQVPINRTLGRRVWHQTLGAALVVAFVLSGVTPALASEATDPAAPKSCDEFDPVVTTTPAELRSQIRADVARDEHGLTGAGVGVAVIDTGINPVGGLDGPGRVVDGPDLSFDTNSDNLRHRDLHGHGTNMASIIAGDGGAHGDGVAPGAYLVNVKAGAADGQVDVSQIIAAIDWVVGHRDEYGIRVLNLAFDTDATQSYVLDPLSRAVEQAWAAGIVVVVAGGNDGRDLGRLGNPATNPFVLAVGAAQADDSPAGFSVPDWSSVGNGIRNPDLVAPGSYVLGAGVPGSYLSSNFPAAVCADLAGGLHLRGSGTSQSAAAVAGAAALLLEQRPGLTPDQVKYLLTSTARPGEAHPTQQGHGLVDVAAALAAPTPGDEATQTFTPSEGTGSLEKSRGSRHVYRDGKRLEGEVTAFGGKWDGGSWRDDQNSGRAWRRLSDAAQSVTGREGFWDGATASWKDWSGATWSGATWSGATWSGATWSGATWSGATWSTGTWSGATWSGATWSSGSWSGATWSGATWSGATWSGATWSGATWSSVAWA